MDLHNAPHLVEWCHDLIRRLACQVQCTRNDLDFIRGQLAAKPFIFTMQ
jgi:hypothetical protein